MSADKGGNKTPGACSPPSVSLFAMSERRHARDVDISCGFAIVALGVMRNVAGKEHRRHRYDASCRFGLFLIVHIRTTDARVNSGPVDTVRRNYDPRNLSAWHLLLRPLFLEKLGFGKL